jgi:dephospho-CoA kinase
MKILGIIGGIGCGKSTAAALFQELGAAVIAADNIGHQILRLPKVKSFIQERWGSAVFEEDGEVDRRKLAAIVFADQGELAHLKSLTHPLIAEEVHRQREEHEQSGVPLCLLDAPLLLESGWDHLVDKIIFVDTPVEMRWHRVKNRGWSETEWRQREAAQLSVDEKKCRADVILDNSGSIEHLRMQVEALVHGDGK